MSQRIYGLDILRASAIIFVMISHGHIYANELINAKYYRWLMWDGVGIFFVLSGFLIGGILIKQVEEKHFEITGLFNFWIRRWLRTIPSYFLVLIILTVCYFYVHHQWPPSIGNYFFFTQCFAQPHPLFFAEAWSLTVEEWFYILIPIFLFIIIQFNGQRKKQILFLILFILIAGTLVRTFKAAQKDYFIDNSFGLEIMKQVITRTDNIMYGVLGAWLAYYKNDLWLSKKNFLFALGISIMFLSVMAISYSHFYYNYFYFSLTAFGTLLLLPALSSIQSGSGWIYRMVTFISVVSYSMYLINHMIVLRAILPKIQKVLSIDLNNSLLNNAILLFLFWAFTLIFSYLLYRFWEQPMMNLRHQLKSPKKY